MDKVYADEALLSMKRPVLALALVVILLTTLAVSAVAKPPRVSRGAARYYTKITLVRHFADWRSRDGGAIRCGDVLSRSKVRCFVEWSDGNLEYAGQTKIWFKRTPEGLAWFYAYRIKRVNRECVQAGNRHCRKTFVVH